VTGVPECFISATVATDDCALSIDGVPKPVLILSGPPGAGKTATARALTAASERAVHLEADRFFRFIRAGYVEPWKPEAHAQNATVMQIVAAAAARYADAAYFTVVEGIVIPRWFLGPLSEGLQAAGHRVAYAVLRAPFDVCLARVGQRGDETPVDAHVISGIWSQFDDLGALEGHVIETTAQPVDAVARTLRESIDGRLLLA
jgi:tRNA uridine 5-carbamoylmethylation protein Kti12